MADLKESWGRRERSKTGFPPDLSLKGMEAMHSLRKGQGTMFAYGHPNPDAVIVSRIFETA